MYRSITALLPLAAFVAAQRPVYTTTLGDVPTTGSSCPNGETVYQDDDQYWCCPGSYIDSFTDNAYCCVGGKVTVPTVTFASCFPFCTGSETSTSTTSMASPTCKATVYLSDSDYNSKVSSAASSASATGSGSGSATTTSDGGSSASGTGAAQTGSSSGQAAGAMVTSGPIMGAMMIAGGLLMAA